MLIGLLLILFSQITLSSTGGISASQSDVDAFLDPMMTWGGSFIDMIITFAPYLIAVFFIFLVLRFLRSK